MRFKNKNKKNSKLTFNRKSSEYAAQRNDEQLHREKILLGYDAIRSTVRPL